MERFRVIMADPPWNFKLYSNKGEGKAPQAHYKCLDLKDIMSLPVADVVTDDAVLFLWATNPMLPTAINVINAWGFTYCTKLEWVKTTKDNSRPRWSTGYRLRGCTEPLIIATKSKTPCPSRSDVLPGVIHSPRREHSRKPEEQWAYFEQYEGPYLELFARHERKNWTQLGNEMDGLDIRESLPELAQRISQQGSLDFELSEVLPVAIGGGKRQCMQMI